MDLATFFSGRKTRNVFVTRHLTGPEGGDRPSFRYFPNLGISVVEASLDETLAFQKEGSYLGLDGLVYVKPEVLVVAAGQLQDGNWALQKLKTDQYETVSKGRGITVAVLDSGIDGSHRALEEAVHPYHIRIDRQGSATRVDGAPTDSSTHGTMVASIISGQRMGDVGLGLATAAKMLSIQVLQEKSGTMAAVLGGLDAVLNYPEVKVVNLSFEIESNPAFILALKMIVNSGRIVVGAAGNTGPGTLASPGNYPRDCIISAGALYENYDVWESSNGGIAVWRDAPAGSKRVRVPTLSAPGAEITGANAGGGLVMMSGTSFAAPHVSAACAILAEKEPGISHQEALETLVASSADLGSANWDNRYGEGTLDIVKALELRNHL